LPGVRRASSLLGLLFDLAERIDGRGRGLRNDLERLALDEPPFIGLQTGLAERFKRRILGQFSQPESAPWRPAEVAVEHLRTAPRPPRFGNRPSNTGASAPEALSWITYLELRQR